MIDFEFVFLFIQAERVETDLQSRFDNLTANVANLELWQEKTKTGLGSTKHQLLETNECYVKDKDQLTRQKTDVDERHQTASVDQDFFEDFIPIFKKNDFL